MTARASLRRNWFAWFSRSVFTRSICLIMALARIFTSTPISTFAIGPRTTANPGSATALSPGIKVPNRAVAAPVPDAVGLVLRVQDASQFADAGDQLGRVLQCVKVLEDVLRDVVAVRGNAVQVRLAVEEHWNSRRN